MNITMRKILDKFFLPCFYGFCIIGIGLAVVFFSDVKKQQKEALLAYERNLNIKSPNESIQLETSDKKEELVYTSSNENIVKVDESGHLISTGEGSAVVTVSTKDKKKSQVLIVNVGQDAIKEYIKNNPKDNKETANTKPVEQKPTVDTEVPKEEKPSTNEPSKNETFNIPEIPQEDNSSKQEDNSSKQENKQPEKPSTNKAPQTTNKTVAVTGVTLNKTSATIGINAKNKTTTLTATVSPSNATNKSVTWTSSDTSVATVNNGVVTAKGIGTATITVTTEDGNKTDSINVVVEPNTTNINVESINLDKSMLELEVGDETNLVVSFNPTNASNKSVEWSSSNDDVATISKTGIIKAISEGITTITVTSEDGNKTATCKLTVVKKTNTDDDIYKDNTDDENNSTNNKNDNKVDDTIAKDKLPNTGFKIVLTILGIGFIFVGIISFIRYRKLIDIK